ncbi:pilus (MSHA type) biogenesis protein MshL [Neptunomonas antarctica]|uniref:MSHA biogenesis protein MshL n=1 Tax=Neptunomonas antarctica TaxID=619304 RepID=A0A1N7MNG1_9GAMM|nr:pilus (MSHA type) biogenesis protein MshL [Neptunomonas antarctica]SIS87538.1 MSHA biogenesis protein MshL [Neptunomonas antarctica]
MKYMQRHLILVMAGFLAGCQSIGHVTEEPPQQESEKILQAAVDAAERVPSVALPMLSSLAPLRLDDLAKVQEERFDVSARQLSARTFFMGLVEGSPYNMIVHEGITGQISLQLKDVTVAEVMKAVRDVYGYEYKRTGNLYQVVPANIETLIYQVNYLDVQREGQSQTSVSAGSVSQAGSTNSSSDSSSNNNSSSDSSGSSLIGTHISTRSKTDFWGGLQETLSAIIGSEKGQRVVVTPQAGVVVVRALPSEQQTVREYLEKAELILGRQVVIEAKILEVKLSNGFQAGIDWQAFGQINDKNSGTYSQSGGTSKVISPTLGGIFSANLKLNDFTALISLLGTQGDVQVLSSPRVSTMNNQKAVIKVGTDEFYVTGVSSTTTTGTATTTTPEVELTPFFSGIALDVTPQISADNEIILHIHPSVSTVEEEQKLISVGGSQFDIPLALSSIRETDSIVRASSGQVIVIGGLMTSGSTDTFAKAPGLGDIPGLGKLFQQRSQGSNKSELVILLRPVIANATGWQQELQRSLEGFQSLKQR